MRKFSIVISILFILSATALNGAGIALSGVGSRAIGLGGAFRGVADDYTAVYWNPAGLSNLKHSSVTLGLAGIIPKGHYTPDLGWPGVTDNKEVETADKTWLVPNLYYTPAAKDDCDFNYGIGVFVPFALGAEWDLFVLPETMPVDVTGDGIPDVDAPLDWPDGFPENEIKSGISVIDIHPTFSYRVNDKFSVGLGISAMRGDIEITKFVPHFRDPAHPEVGSSYGTYLPTIVKLEGSGWGFGANIGFIYKIMPNLQMGVSGKLPSVLKLEGDATMTAYVNSVIAQGLGLPGPVADSRELDVEADLKLPADAGIGFCYYPMENLMLACDVTWTQWSRLDKIEVEYDGQMPITGADATTSEIITDWDNTIRISLGGEYKMDDWVFRGGYYFDQTPIPDETLDPTWPDISDMSSANVGVSYTFSNFVISAEYEYIFFPDRTIDESHIHYDEEHKGVYEGWAGDYKTHIDAFNFAFEYMF